jgi:hypothetical protein
MSRCWRSVPWPFLGHLALGLALGWPAAGCDEVEPSSKAAGSPEQGAEPTVEAAGRKKAKSASPRPSDDDEPPEPQGEALSLSVKESRLLESVDADAPVTLRAATDVDRVEVHLRNFRTYCEEVPSFTARSKGNVIQVQLEPTESKRCRGPHSFKLHIDLPAKEAARRVIMVDDEGSEIARTDITSGG